MNREPGRIDRISASAYIVPTETAGEPRPESDGTAQWDSTGVLVVEVSGPEVKGLGYSYTSAPAALAVVRDLLAPVVLGRSVDEPAAIWSEMVAAVRNAGRAGVCSSAISAIDIAVHDAQARRLDTSLLSLLGAARGSVRAYGSGGFTDYDDRTLVSQLEGWAEQGFDAVKMKIGSTPTDDARRVAVARDAIGDSTALFVDANGAHRAKAALGVATMLDDVGVVWFEEPVSSDDLEGMRLVRTMGPAGIDIAAGEYGHSPEYFHGMLAAGAVDVLQADATRCGGVSGFRAAAILARAAGRDLSAHTAPALHAVLGAAFDVVHVEYFHDHALIEGRYFDGVASLVDGRLLPDPAAIGLGLEFKRADAEPALVAQWISET